MPIRSIMQFFFFAIILLLGCSEEKPCPNCPQPPSPCIDGYCRFDLQYDGKTKSVALQCGGAVGSPIGSDENQVIIAVYTIPADVTNPFPFHQLTINLDSLSIADDGQSIEVNQSGDENLDKSVIEVQYSFGYGLSEAYGLHSGTGRLKLFKATVDSIAGTFEFTGEGFVNNQGVEITTNVRVSNGEFALAVIR